MDAYAIGLLELERLDGLLETYLDEVRDITPSAEVRTLHEATQGAALGLFVYGDSYPESEVLRTGHARHCSEQARGLICSSAWEDFSEPLDDLARKLDAWDAYIG